MSLAPGDVESDARPLAERVSALLARRARGGETRALTTFARLLLRRASAYVEALPEADVAAMVDSAYRFYAAPGPDLRVRAFVPTYDTQGWDASGCVVETCISDRAFVVDTIRARLEAAGVPVRALLHPVFLARRDPTGRLDFLGEPEPNAPRESFTHVAIGPVGDAEALARLRQDIETGLEDVRLVTDDFAAMVERAQGIAAELEALGRLRPAAVAADAAAVAEFLRWLVDGSFVFLGYREYGIATIGSASLLRVRAGSGLGVLRRESRSLLAEPRPVDQLPEHVRARLFGARLLTVAKTTREAPVHRAARMDDIGVKELDADGRVIGARRFLGLFSSKAYAEESSDVPLLRRLLRQILAAEHAMPGSHDHKQILAIFNALPKGHLLASVPADVLDDVRTMLAATLTDEVGVSVRVQAESRRLALLVALPREHFSDDARQRVAAAVAARLGSELLDTHVALLGGTRALLYFAFALPTVVEPEAIRTTVLEEVRSWEERLRAVLVARGAPAAARWSAAFPPDYRATVTVEKAADDVLVLDTAARDGSLHVRLEDDADPATSAVRFYVPREPLVLSECMPMLENLGLRVLAEDQVTVTPPDGERFFLQTFRVRDRAGRPIAAAAGPRLIDAILAVTARRTEDDVLNRLVLDAGLDWRAAGCLRAYAGYAAQAGLAARSVIVGALVGHPETAAALFACFAARFSPAGVATDPATLRQRFLANLDAVAALPEDLALRTLLDCVTATVRTNFFRPERRALALKLRAADIPQLAPPRPLYEIYVRAPTMEGIHLRAGKVARGGIRHSDRPDDFRTEILALMRTQTVKNAVIVPTGAKGGFVAKGSTPVTEAYATFIRALLDLTDNLVAGRVVHPLGLVLHDEEDPYLVVAADKGTASFSDLANQIAAEHGFWLGDAFASGGAHGYDHKALGITARGVWESVRAHFRELALDANTAPLAVAGIGDMGGDVFGNGMLRSPHLRLRAAFNHRHVFLDPDPDPARSYAERRRLFEARLGWDAYDPTALSPGGVVVERAAKRVTLSPEAQTMLGLGPEPVSGERLVQTVLALDGDLLFNGGVGTYVAASNETDAEVHDPANDGARVRASALRVRVVAEGGNLGFTQRARIEYALAGGHINTDAVDNSAGVDMSDHEVNLKICLQDAVRAGRLTVEARNALLAAVTDDVSARVLAHNGAQNRLLGMDQVRSRTRVAHFRELAAELEHAAGLDRVLEMLPDADVLRARRGAFLGLTRPELAVLIAYTKIQLHRELLASTLPDEPLLTPYLCGYFPRPVAEAHAEAVLRHPLRREIVATEVSNTVVDQLGSTFVWRVAHDTGVAIPAAVRAWAIAWAVGGGAALAAAIADDRYGTEVEITCRTVLERTMERATKWVLANVAGTRPADAVVAELTPPLVGVRARLAAWLVGPEAQAFQRLLAELEIAGLDPALARELATADWMAGALDVALVARETGSEPDAVAARYYALGEFVDFAWLWARLAEAGEEDRWQRRAAEGLAEDVLTARRRLTRQALTGQAAAPSRALASVQDLIRDLRVAPRATLAGLAVVARELRRLTDDTASSGGHR